ncbi:uncharacterized protein F5Z01DRAFT_671881 [Emericellopsis atlantica]|uniref:Stc1 domain-containing protein n=1 Tax=Emericellopsis atlantica TaxID=2614577 RepID=A0A9P7ZR82_9HYPO|nr:uncharacterized protein F5Z01DRAFT_671881 [Emericellopsis atlantica]KAG9256631.1 hypothetical protein F5Z01DRAFT_671881 [Emericellopsis atlantica]
MPDEISCDQCGLVLPYDQFSKQQRKMDDPCCKRCVAWTETQEPEIPSSWGGSETVWNEQSLAPLASVTNRSSVGAEDRGKDPVDERDDRVSNAGFQNYAGSTASVSSAPARKLPPHLQSRVKSNAPSTAGSVASSEAGGAITSTATSQQRLPPHLRSMGASSISTATTVRKEKDDIKNWNSQTYNAYGPNGESQQRVRQPSTAASASTSDYTPSMNSNGGTGRPGEAAPGGTRTTTPAQGKPQGSTQADGAEDKPGRKWAKPSKAPRGYYG